MHEGIRSFIGKKLEQVGEIIRPADGLLLFDDPALHRLIKQRIRKELANKDKRWLDKLQNLYKQFSQDADLNKQFVHYLTQEVELQQIDFLNQQEKLRKPVFEKILKRVTALDFRDFVSSAHDELSVYDPEVITPQLSWFVEQIFTNLPGFFDFFSTAVEQDESLAESQVDTIRNIFILGYIHGFFDKDKQDSETAKDYLTYFVNQSDASEDKIKDYPTFLREIAESNKRSLASPRLQQLKQHWKQQFARRWLLLSRTDEASVTALSEATLKQVIPTLPTDGRLFENQAVARKMDQRSAMQAAWTGTNPSSDWSHYEDQQVREEGRLHMDIAQSQRSTATHMRDCLRLYQGNDGEVFQDGQKTSEKWSSYKMVAEQILQELASRFSSLRKAENHKEALDAAMAEIVDSMLQAIARVTKKNNTKIEDFFGADFMNLARVEQLCLLAFTALSFIKRETTTSKLAVQTLDRFIVPQLDRYFDINTLKEKSSTSTALRFSEFNPQFFQEKSVQAKKVLNGFSIAEGLVSTDGFVFKYLLKEKKQLLGNVSGIYSFFAKIVGENWKDHAVLKPGFLGLLFALTAFASGYLNFNLSQELLGKSMEMLYAEDPTLFVLKLLPIFLTGVSGALFLGQKARNEFKQLAFSSSKLAEQLRRFGGGGWRQIATLLFLSFYSMSSTFPLWEDQARDAWQTMRDRWEELFKDEAVTSDGSSEQSFWEDRNPEAQNPRDIEKIEKTKWGEIVIGEDIYGKDNRSPIGFINTFSVSPSTINENGVQEFATTKVIDGEIAPLLIFAQDAVVVNGTIMVTMSDGSSFRQEAFGADFVIMNGPLNGSDGFVKFVDSNRYIEKIIVMPKPEIAAGFSTLSFSTYESFKYATPDDLRQLIGGGYDYFVVYRSKQNEIPTIRQYEIDLSENFKYWQEYRDERNTALDILKKENPEAAALYARMIEEQEQFWTAFVRGGGEIGVDSYALMIQRQADEYNDFVHSNHVYSLRYDPTTDYTRQYPNIGVMLDVMSLDKGGYYCATAHLAAQQWFLSLGVQTDGLYGYHVYNDANEVRSRVGHVQTGLYGLVYDFTPSTPNPGEDLSSLSFNPQEAVATNDPSNVTAAEKTYAQAMELLEKFASKENVSWLIFLLSTAVIGYSVKLGVDQVRRKNNRGQVVEQIRALLPDEELEIKTLASALIQLFNELMTMDGLVVRSDDKENSLRIAREILLLASTPTDSALKKNNATRVSPEVFSLLKILGLSNELADSSDVSRVGELWKKISENKDQTIAILSDLLAAFDTIHFDLRQSHELKKQVLEKDIRRLQRQLFKARKKENQLYQGYGSVLERTGLMSIEQLNNRRRTTTADLFVLNRDLELKQKELQQLVTQSKLLPKNVRNLKKVLQFIFQVEEKTTHD